MSFADKLKSFFGIRAALDDAFFDGLADILVEGDFGAALAFETVDLLRQRCRKEKADTPEAAKRLLAEMLTQTLKSAGIGTGIGTDTDASDTSGVGDTDASDTSGVGGAGASDTSASDTGVLSVVLLLGVNGVGKTTTAAKLAALFQKEGRTLLAAADTFRAAAIDQLKIHGERLGIRTVAHKPGGDPAAVVYDAVEAALAGGCRFVIADTAGRMHTKSALVEELKKISRVIDLKGGKGDKPPLTLRWLVLDATTGGNALVQAETFHEAVRLDGVILTKTDSGAKGGVAFALAAKLRLPVLYICNGEKYDNISPFNADIYVREFLGRD
jgi:fused signal recognition particle receptor